jgi:hypothetical protein
MAPTRQEIADVAGCDSDFVSNIVNRGLLKSKLSETSAGVARDFTRVNALEISFIVPLTDVGYSPSLASAKAHEWIAAEAKGKLPPWYVENRYTSENILCSTAAETGDDGRSVSLAEWATTLADEIEGGWRAEESNPQRPATRLAVIHLKEIIRRVDELFAVNTDDNNR